MRTWRKRSRYAAPTDFGGFDLKTTGSRFAGFGPQNPEEDLRVTHGIIGEFALRRSFFMKVFWPSGAQNSTCTIMPLGLYGSEKISKVILECIITL